MSYSVDMTVDVTRNSPFPWDWLTVFKSKSKLGGELYFVVAAIIFVTHKATPSDCFILSFWRRSRKSSFSKLFVFVKDRYLSLDFASSISDREERGRRMENEGECEFPANLTCTCYTFWGRGGKLVRFGQSGKIVTFVMLFDSRWFSNGEKLTLV